MRRRAFLAYINLGDSPLGPEFSVAVVIDDSGSMSGDPIQEVRQAFKDFVEKAPEGTKIGLVGFGTETHVYSEPTEYREFLLDQVDRFQGKSGSTNLYDAVGFACDLFDLDERHRYILALTDGGDTGSPHFNLQKPSPGKKSLIDYAVERQVRVLTVGFGEHSDHDNLRLLADSTGGHFFPAGKSSDLLQVFQQALSAILEERAQVRLRPEFGRLLKASLAKTPAEETPWLSHLSIDEWQEKRTWSDSTHLRFPSPQSWSAGEYHSLLNDTLAPEVTRLWSDQVMAAKGNTFDLGVDLIIVGWLHDPAFRALSCDLTRVFDGIQRRFSAELRGSITFTFVPLLFQIGRLDETAKKECYAWLTAARNSLSGCGPGWDRRPLAILPIGQGNQHSRLNRQGLSGLDTTKILLGSANVLRCAMLAPSLLDEAANHPEKPLHAVGAASVSAGLDKVVRESLLSSLQQCTLAFRTSKVNSADISSWVDDLIRNQRLGLMEVKDTLLAPLGSSEGGILAKVRLDVSIFWPPPPFLTEDEYLATLTWAVEETGSEYLYRKIEILRRTLAARTADRAATAISALTTKVDDLLFEFSGGRIQQTFAFLDTVRGRLADERARISQEGGGKVATELERLRLFSDDERSVFSLGTSDSQSARQRLEDCIKNRPKAEALFLRHGMLALLLGGIAERLCRFLPPGLINLGPFQAIPLLAGALVAAGTVGVGVVRWVHSRQRIATALKEYCGALVREARQRAISLVIKELLAFYESLVAWIGEDRKVPVPGEDGRHESQLTEIQRISCLDLHAADFVEALSRRHSENATRSNFSVLDIGSQINNPVPPPPTLDLRSSLLAAGPTVLWSSIAPKKDNGSWRQVCRRKLFDNLAAYLSHHGERIEFPRRVWANLERLLSTQLIDQRRLGHLLPSTADHAQVEPILNILSFPPLFLSDTTRLTAPQAGWFVNAQEADSLRQAGMNPNPLALNLEASWEAHTVKAIRPELSDLEDWMVLRSPWEALPTAEKQRLLATWSTSLGEWRDPSSGDLCFPASAPADLSDQGEL